MHAGRYKYGFFKRKKPAIVLLWMSYEGYLSLLLVQFSPSPDAGSDDHVDPAMLHCKAYFILSEALYSEIGVTEPGSDSERVKDGNDYGDEAVNWKSPDLYAAGLASEGERVGWHCC